VRERRKLDLEFAQSVIEASYKGFEKIVPKFRNNYEAKVEQYYQQELELLGIEVPDIAEPQVFDALSYAMFKVFGENISKPNERMRVTEIIGRLLYNEIKGKTSLRVSGNPKDLSIVKEGLEKIIGYFKDVGYVKDAEIIWEIDQSVWLEKGKGTFYYVMTDPVILPSAQSLYREMGFAQHFSSRVIEAFFNEFKVDAKEDKNFDPTQYDAEKVIEKWAMICKKKYY
jgi:hypothetical protein